MNAATLRNLTIEEIVRLSYVSPIDVSLFRELTNRGFSEEEEETMEYQAQLQEDNEELSEMTHMLEKQNNVLKEENRGLRKELNKALKETSDD